MKAFHTCSSAPFFALAGAKEFRLEAFELLCMALSALLWRRENGSICLVTDSVVASYLREQGLEALWDDGVWDTLDVSLEGLDPRTFWAAGKLLALRGMKAPCAMIDMDFIVWKDITPIIKERPLVVAHREALYKDVYPPLDTFQVADDYAFPEGLPVEAYPCNTAFAYFGDEDFRRTYVEESLRFMHAARGEDSLTYMVFAEQRLLAMLAESNRVPIDVLLPMDGIFEPQGAYTHLWGHKRRLRTDVTAREDFIRRCLMRIRGDFPDWFPIIAASREIAPCAEEMLAYR